MESFATKVADIKARYVAQNTDYPPCKVTDRIWLRSMWDANDVDWLRRTGITHVVNCAQPNDRFERVTARAAGIRGVLVLDADDAPDYPILQLHSRAVKTFLDRVLSEPDAKVLIHCMAGVNRSAALVLAYAAYHEDIEVQRSKFLHIFEHVLKQRPIILINDSFYEQLVQWAYG
jgi:predicted protein tyrosine phosphatase